MYHAVQAEAKATAAGIASGLEEVEAVYQNNFGESDAVGMKEVRIIDKTGTDESETRVDPTDPATPCLFL